jgi:hypothetical protein
MCDTCGFFFDVSEGLDAPPVWSDVVQNVSAVIDLYQSICQGQQQVEALRIRGKATNIDVLRVERTRQQAKQAILELFIKVTRKQ